MRARFEPRFTADAALAYFAPLVAERDALRKERDQYRLLDIVGACPCGIATIKHPDSIDGGSCVTCEAGHEIVFDVWSPEDRASFFAERDALRKDLYEQKRLLGVSRASEELLAHEAAETEEAKDKVS